MPTKEKTITRAELRRLSIRSRSKPPSHVNLDGKRLWWTGIGWHGDGPLRGDEVLVVDQATRAQGALGKGRTG